MRDYYLMHKDYKVALLSIDRYGEIKKIKALLNQERLPIEIKIKEDLKDELNIWLKRRGSICYSDIYKKIYPRFGVKSGGELLLKSYALSVTDCYWLRPEPNLEKLKWKTVNLYDNEISNDISLLLISPSYCIESIQYNSPNLTMQGDNFKFWITDRRAKKNYLFKPGMKNTQYQTSVYSEIICALINKRLGLNRINYTLVNLCTADGIIPCSVCESMFQNDKYELVTMQEYINSGYSIEDIINLIYENHLEIPFYKMIVSDYIVMNTDRNFQNFGVIRDSETLGIVGLAPLYDNTNCLYYDWETRKIGSYDEAKPFYPTHEEQIKMVKDFSWYDDSSLWSIETDTESVLAASSIPLYIRDAIKKELRKRIGLLNSYINEKYGQIKSLDDRINDAKIEIIREREQFEHGELKPMTET